MWTVNFQVFKLDFKKQRNQRSNCQFLDHWKSKRVPEKHLLQLIYYAKAFVWITTNCGTFWKRWEYQTIWPATCLLRNLYLGQEATVRTRHGAIDWFQIGKGVCQGYVLSPCLFNLYAEYIIRNAGLKEAQAGIKIARRNINNLRYAADTTLMAETEELKRLLMKAKEETEKVSFSQSVSQFSCRLFATPWTTAWQASLSITNSQSLLKLMSIESLMPPNHLILCHPLLLLPSIFPSIKVFSNE